MSYPEHIQRYIELVRAAEKACEEASLYAWRELEDCEREELGDQTYMDVAYGSLLCQLDLFEAIANKEGN